MATTTATELREPTSFSALEIRELRLEDLERFARTGKKLALREWLALAEAWRIAQALREHRGNRAATARSLGIGRRTLYTKMEKLGLVPSWGVPASELPQREL
jgi:DNA-binding NtrC family response regulator